MVQVLIRPTTLVVWTPLSSYVLSFHRCFNVGPRLFFISFWEFQDRVLQRWGRRRRLFNDVGVTHLSG
jgi:hypothetical protein